MDGCGDGDRYKRSFAYLFRWWYVLERGNLRLGLGWRWRWDVRSGGWSVGCGNTKQVWIDIYFL